MQIFVLKQILRRTGVKIGHLAAVDSHETSIDEDVIIPQVLHYTRSIARIRNADTVKDLDEAEMPGGSAKESMIQLRLRNMVR